MFRPQLGAFFPPPSLDVRPDLRVAGVTIALVVFAGLATGLAPAWRIASESVSGALNRELIAGEPRRGRLRSTLVVVQMAVATLVLVGVGVSIHSLRNLQHVSLGFSARHLAFTGVDMRRSGYNEQTGRLLYERLRERLGRVPGIEAVSLADGPPTGNGWGRDYVVPDGAPIPQNGHGTEVPISVVDERYFSTMAIERLAGRTFDARDQKTTVEVVVINATMAQRLWPGKDPIGQRLRIENGNRRVEVIGVVADGKYEDIGEPPRPFMYLALQQHYQQDIVAIARTAGRAAPLLSTIEQAVHEIEPNVVFGGLGHMTLEDLLAIPLFIPRAIVATVSTFGMLTLILAVVGLYSTVFYSVSQRRNEMGIRIALGAQPRDLFAIVLRHTAMLAATGAAIGVTSGAAALPAVSSLFYGIGPVDPIVIAGVVFVSIAIAMLTAYVATRPWTRMSPLEMVRQE
jgi:putative ABC transport system permease protein